MIVRAKTKRRLVILLAAALGTVLALAGAYAVAMKRKHERLMALRAEGVAAHAAGDLPRAMDKLAKYLKEGRYADDAEAVELLADANLRHERADGGHLVAAASQYRRLLELRPDRRDVLRKLMGLYRDTDKVTEAVAAADRLLAAEPGDREALRVRAMGLWRLGRAAEALVAARAAVTPPTGDELDVETQILLLQLYVDPANAAEAARDPANAGAPGSAPTTAPATGAETAIRRARKLLAAHPEDGRFELLMSTAYALAREVPAWHREELRLELARGAAAATSAATTRPATTMPTVGPGVGEPDAAALAAAGAVHYARRAAQRPVAGPKDLRLLLRQLDALRMGREALEVIVRSQETAAQDAWLRRYAARRLYEGQRYAELERFAAGRSGAKGQAQPASASEIETTGMRAVALARLGRAEEAEALADALEGKASSSSSSSSSSAQEQQQQQQQPGTRADQVARAWAAAARHRVAQARRKPTSPRVLAEACEEGLKAAPGSAYLACLLGEAYAELGQREKALRRFAEAVERSPQWAEPLERRAAVEAEAGDYERARESAAKALAIGGSATSAALYAMASGALLGEEKLAGATDLLKMVREVQRARPLEPGTLPLFVALLAKNGREAEAKEVLASALEAARREGSPLPESCLLALARVARSLKLGDPEAFHAAAEAAHGLTAEHALALAVERARAGRPAEQVRAEFEAAAARRPRAGDERSWALARARLLEGLGDAKAAAEAWVALADRPEHKDDAAVQREALAAASVQQDRAFLARTAERLRLATGGTGTAWRKAQAKLLLAERPAAEVDAKGRSERTAEAQKLLADVVEADAEDAEAHALLAGLAEEAGEARKAIEHLSAAVKARPTAEGRLALAALHHAAGELDKARGQLDALSGAAGGGGGAALDAGQRLRAARMRVLLGDAPAAAIALLAGADGGASLDTEGTVFLAELHRAAGSMEKAEAAYRQALERSAAERGRGRALAVAGYADLLASRGALEEARRTLEGLAALELPAGLKEHLRAEFESRHGTAEAALALHRAAVAADPSNDAAWAAIVTAHVRAGRAAEAVAAGVEGAKAAPASKRLAPFRTHAELLGRAAADRRLANLVIALVSTPDDSLSPASSSAALEAMESALASAAAKEGPGARAARLRAILDRAPRLLALRMIVVEDLAAAGQREEAALLAERGLELAPTSADAARQAAAAQAAAGQWRKALETGRRWRALAGRDAARADVFLAEMHLRLGEIDAAAALVQPYITAAGDEQVDASTRREATVLRSLAHVRKGESGAATALLEPRLKEGAAWRAAWIEQALVLKDAAEAARWLEKADAAVPADALVERAGLASAWYRLGAARNSAEHRAKGVAMLDALIAAGPAAGGGDGEARARGHTAALRVRAQVAELEGDLAGAEAAYRKVLAAAPADATTKNNLAMVLVRRKGDLEEARKLATAAVAAAPEVPAFHDTLACVLTAAKDFAGAMASAQAAARLDPRNPEWKLRVALVHEAAGARFEARRAVEEVERALAGAGGAGLSEEARRELEAVKGRLR